MKLFESIDVLIALLCFAEAIHNPWGARGDIRRDPASSLAAFNRHIHNPRTRPCQKQAYIGKVRPI